MEVLLSESEIKSSKMMMTRTVISLAIIKQWQLLSLATDHHHSTVKFKILIRELKGSILWCLYH